VPLFASTNPASLGVILLTFFVLVGVWCLLAYNLTRHPAIPALLTRFGHILVPLVFIGLGIYILLENGTLGWIGIVSRDLGSFGAISGGGIR
jgi:cadmium resistance protein CadD (predicted permease)